MSKKIDIDPNDIYMSTYHMVSYAEHFSEEDYNIIENTYKSLSNIEDPGVSIAVFHKFLYEENFELLTCPNCYETCYFKWLFLGWHKHSDCGHKWMETPWRILWGKIKRIFGPLKGDIKLGVVLSLLALPLHIIVYLISGRSKAKGEIQKKESQPLQKYEPIEQIVDLGDTVSLTIIKIPIGDFVMGGKIKYSPSEQLPAHKVSFRQGFWLGKYPVTQAQYRAVTGSSPSKYGGDDLPVENLTWEEAQAFLDALNKRLYSLEEKFRFPTEAEWEYACRAGNTGHYCFGDEEAMLKEYAWFDELVKDATYPIGTKKPNAWGLHDMHGNVGEWCADEWHDNYEGAPQDGSAWQNGDGDRIVRGGHFTSSAESCRSANRDGREPYRRFEFVGLRIARTAND